MKINFKKKILKDETKKNQLKKKKTKVNSC